MPAGEFAIGSWKWGPKYGSVSIKQKSAADNKQVKADGKNDARTTFRGRKNAELSIAITWKMDRAAGGGRGPIDTYVMDFLADISPRGANAGKSWAWVEDDQRIHNVNDVTVDDLETDRKAGTGSGSATIKLSSWVKPAPSAAVTKTATKPEPWSPGVSPAPVTLTPDPPGFLNDATKPKVNP